ncbi:MAG: alpha-glucosidase C-terminal domain-containing protein [Anaerolineae bacterium]|nr:alpha-glucosidase C-terminal domain-containing protein [Anaerolineae bacterium]
MNLDHEINVTLRRLIPRLEPHLPDSDSRREFNARLDQHFPAIFRLLLDLYGDRYDFFYHLEQILIMTASMYMQRPAALKALDREREAHPLWFQSEDMMGGVCYVDLFAGDLNGIRAKIPYFKELKLTYLHLMPLFKCPPDNSDGGYAVSSYREVNSDLGTTEQLAALAADLRAEGISLVLDFVFNHTSDEHTWARQALAGDEDYQAYYLMFDDRTLPDQYERNLREIFPEQAPGNFTFRPEIDQWVWTTFNHFQWDLNYANPAVFRSMLAEMLFIANVGAEVLRLDAVAFIWKKMGTSCEGLPQVHTIIQAFNALVKIAAPAMLFKSEAIVHPAEVAKYIAPEEAPISYNPTLMALLWESLATREVKLLHHSMQRRFDLPEGCTWVNYVRCHDDIGWTFADEDAWELNMNGFNHRQFLNQFYTGKFTGSFARGVPFNYNPVNQDMRISGMGASLAGLEYALDTGIDQYQDWALRRIELIHSVIISAGGIPLIYLGDEIAMLNDYGYKDDPNKAEDSRWVHRPTFDWERAAQRNNPDTDAGRIFSTLTQLITLRQQTPAFANGDTRFMDTHNPHVLGYVRGGEILVLANFSEHAQDVRLGWMPSHATDLITGEAYPRHKPVTLAAYQFVWLAAGE